MCLHGRHIGFSMISRQMLHSLWSVSSSAASNGSGRGGGAVDAPASTLPTEATSARTDAEDEGHEDDEAVAAAGPSRMDETDAAQPAMTCADAAEEATAAVIAPPEPSMSPHCSSCHQTLTDPPLQARRRGSRSATTLNKFEATWSEKRKTSANRFVWMV